MLHIGSSFQEIGLTGGFAKLRRDTLRGAFRDREKLRLNVGMRFIWREAKRAHQLTKAPFIFVEFLRRRPNLLEPRTLQASVLEFIVGTKAASERVTSLTEP